MVRSLIAREVPRDQDVFGEEYQRKATSHGKCRGKERVRRTGGAADQVVVFPFPLPRPGLESETGTKEVIDMKIATPSKRVGASNALASLMFQAQNQSNNPKGAPNQRAGFCVSQDPTTPAFTIGIMWSIA